MEEPNLNTTKLPNNQTEQEHPERTLLVSGVIILILGLFVGYFFGRFSIKKPLPSVRIVEVTPTPNPQILTDPYTVLKNPVFDEWYGGFRAKVIAKTGHSFTVERNGGKLQIFMQKSISRLVDQTASQSAPSIITINQLPIGATVDGSVTISKGTLTGNPEEHVIANGVSVISK